MISRKVSHCPVTHPFAFDYGTQCCKTNRENAHHSYHDQVHDSTCDGGELSQFSTCCENDAISRCKGEFVCQNGNENYGKSTIRMIWNGKNQYLKCLIREQKQIKSCNVPFRKLPSVWIWALNIRSWSFPTHSVCPNFLDLFHFSKFVSLEFLRKYTEGASSLHHYFAFVCLWKTNKKLSFRHYWPHSYT